MSNTVANLQENRAVFRYFVALLSFSFNFIISYHQGLDYALFVEINIGAAFL